MVSRDWVLGIFIENLIHEIDTSRQTPGGNALWLVEIGFERLQISPAIAGAILPQQKSKSRAASSLELFGVYYSHLCEA